jgi:hypothetical protein
VALVNGFKVRFCFKDSNGQIKDGSLLYSVQTSRGSPYLNLELAKDNACCYCPLVSIYYCICSSEELTSFLSCFVSISGLRHLDGVISEDSWEQPNQGGFKGSLIELLVRDYSRATQSSKVRRKKLDLCHSS